MVNTGDIGGYNVGLGGNKFPTNNLKKSGSTPDSLKLATGSQLNLKEIKSKFDQLSGEVAISNPVSGADDPVVGLVKLDQQSKALRQRIIGAAGDPDQLRAIQEDIKKFIQFEQEFRIKFSNLENQFFQEPNPGYSVQGDTAHAKWGVATLIWIDNLLIPKNTQPVSVQPQPITQSDIEPKRTPDRSAQIGDDSMPQTHQLPGFWTWLFRQNPSKAEPPLTPTVSVVDNPTYSPRGPLLRP